LFSPCQSAASVAAKDADIEKDLDPSALAALTDNSSSIVLCAGRESARIPWNDGRLVCGAVPVLVAIPAKHAQIL
jgi:hypothetical protein